MLTVANPNKFIKDIEQAIVKRVEPSFDKAQKIGYKETKIRTPEVKGHGRGILRSRLEYGTRASKRNALLVKGIRFGHLDQGRIEALGKMQKGYRGLEPTNTKPIRDWLESIGKSWMINLGQIEVGRSPQSRFYGGNKNPIQYGMKEMKKSIETQLKVKFK